MVLRVLLGRARRGKLQDQAARPQATGLVEVHFQGTGVRHQARLLQIARQRIGPCVFEADGGALGQYRHARIFF